jgi:transposase
VAGGRGVTLTLTGVDALRLTCPPAVAGTHLATTTVPATAQGYQRLLTVAAEHGPRQPDRRIWAIEGTGGYGAGLTRLLTRHGEQVVELDRPKRPKRPARRHGARSDALDAVRAARDALARARLGQPRTSDGRRHALALLLAARHAAVHTRHRAQNQLQLHALLITAPRPPAGPPHQPAHRRLCAAARPPALGSADPHHRHGAAYDRLRTPALSIEAATHAKAIRKLVRAWRPDLLTRHGSARSWPPRCCVPGPIPAESTPRLRLRCWAGPRRSRPIPASLGQTQRHRLNRCGDRQLNRALHTIALPASATTLRDDPATRADAQRRRAQGKTDRESKRCLVRYIARQLYRLLETPGDET